MPQELIPVSFLDNTLYIIEHNGEPYVPMRPLVEGMGLAWPVQYRKLNSNGKRWGVTLMVTPSKGGDQKSHCLPLRKLPAFLWSIQPKNVKKNLRARLERYQNDCDDVLWNSWNDIHPQKDGQIEALQQELLQSRRRWRKILSYLGMGLNYSEVARLMETNISRFRVERRRMEACGLLVPPANLVERQAHATRYLTTREV